MREEGSSLHDTDVVLWSERQAELLRRRAAGELVNEDDIDWLNVAEEIESMGRAERDQLTNRLGVLLAHLLKWRHQPGLRGNSWRLTIAEQRRRIERLLRRNPSLKADLATILADAYGDALLMAQRETGLPEDTFPAGCPWTFEQAMHEELAP